MKVPIFAFVITYISAVSTFEVKKIEGVKGNVLQVLFDSNFNSYLISSDQENPDNSNIYKLDPENNVVFVKEIINGDCLLMLNDKDDLYTICSSYNVLLTVNISIIRANTSEMEHIATVENFLSVTGDDAGNLMYSGFYPGLFILKYNTTETVVVKNLENFIIIYDPTSTDKNGNTYLQGFKWDTEIGIAEHQFAVVLGDSKEGTPEGYIIEGLLDNPDKDYVDSISINSNNELLVVVTDGQRTSSVKKISNGTITTIYANEEYDRYSVTFNEKRTLIVADNIAHHTSRMTSLSPDGEIVEILNSKNKTWSLGAKGISIDEDGNAFIEWKSLQKSYLEFLNYTDTTTVDVDTGDIKFIYYTVIDGLNNLWIATDRDLYFLEKGSLEIQIVPNSTNLLDMWVNTKKKASEAYMSTREEFYVISI